MTAAAGTDIVSVSRVSGLISRGGTRFLERWFTADEIAYCNAKSQPSLHFAARLAAKEAVFKVLHTSGEGPIPWRSIEITHDRLGAPDVRLSGSLLEAATSAGIGTIAVSLSHCDDYATSVAIAEREARSTAEVVSSG